MSELGRKADYFGAKPDFALGTIADSCGSNIGRPYCNATIPLQN